MRVNVHTGDGSGLWRRVTAATRAPGPRGPSAGYGGSSTNRNWTRTEPSPIGTTKVELPGLPGVRHEKEPVTSLVQQPQVCDSESRRSDRDVPRGPTPSPVRGQEQPLGRA